jgi:hypothetical protein
MTSCPPLSRIPIQGKKQHRRSLLRMFSFSSKLPTTPSTSSASLGLITLCLLAFASQHRLFLCFHHLIDFLGCFHRSRALASASELTLVISSLPSHSQHHFIPFEILEVWRQDTGISHFQIAVLLLQSTVWACNQLYLSLSDPFVRFFDVISCFHSSVTWNLDYPAFRGLESQLHNVPITLLYLEKMLFVLKGDSTPEETASHPRTISCFLSPSSTILIRSQGWFGNFRQELSHHSSSSPFI